MRTRWLIDFDGCLVPTLVTLVSRINKEFDTSFSLDNVLDIQEFWKSVPEPYVHWAWSEKCFDNESFLRTMEAYPMAVETIRLLLELRCPVVVVTDRPARHVPWIREWLFRRKLMLPVVSSETRNENKTFFVSEYQITTVVEDSPTHASQFIAEPIQKLFLFSTSWNKKVSVNPPSERLESWSDLYNRIKEEQG